jgi:hypothetical protein
VKYEGISLKDLLRVDKVCHGAEKVLRFYVEAIRPQVMAGTVHEYFIHLGFE